MSNPLIDAEENIIKSIFGEDSSQMKAYKGLACGTVKDLLKTRFQLDADIFKAAKKKGYDAIALVTEKGIKNIKEGKLPRSVELNIFDIGNISMQKDRKARGLA